MSEHSPYSLNSEGGLYANLLPHLDEGCCCCSCYDCSEIEDDTEWCICVYCIGGEVCGIHRPEG